MKEFCRALCDVSRHIFRDSSPDSLPNLEARGRLHALKLLISEADGICKLLAEYAGIPFVSGRSRSARQSDKQDQYTWNNSTYANILDITRSVTAGD